MTTEKFNALEKSKQRVLVAKDVLAQIAAKKYKPESGCYIQFNSRIESRVKPLQVREDFDKLGKCKVCALGASVLSIARFKNSIDTKDAVDMNSWMARDNKVEKLLKSVFSKKQLALIEGCFEPDANNNYTMQDGIELSEKEQQKCENFNKSYETDESRLKAIMKNIIANNGIFKP